jgi:hypothetical protein
VNENGTKVYITEFDRTTITEVMSAIKKMGAQCVNHKDYFSLMT